MPLKKKPYRQFYRWAAVFALFQKDLTLEKIADKLARLEEETPDFSRIRCPLCHWQPKVSSCWCCENCGYPEYFFNACGTLWNTFTTRGLCPGCGHQWRWTTCLYCYGWSLHEDWYTREKD